MFSHTIQVNQPIWVGTTALDEIRRSVSGYSHKIGAFGGFLSSEMSINTSKAEAENWAMEGLGRDIVVYGDDLQEIWNGFVNGISIELGSLSFSRGPLLAIANDVTVAYQTTSYATNPPVPGYRATTAAGTNADSQTSYGVLERILSGGQTDATEAAQIRDTYLTENKDPQTNHKVKSSGKQGPTVKLSCVGYGRFLERYYYAQTVSSGQINTNAKIQAVVTADPSSRLSTDYGNVTTNTLQVGAYENGDRTGLAVIKDIVSRGDSSDNRYLFGVYEGRKISYGAIPTDYEYVLRLHDPEKRVRTVGGQEVFPWNVRPGKWLFHPDFLTGFSMQPNTGDLRDDPRVMFIESVRYSAVFGLEINGQKVGTLSQLLAKQGTGTI
jgi:hypothetical protein